MSRFRIAFRMTETGPVLAHKSYLVDLERKGFAAGDLMNAVITKPRNRKHHRKSMAWIGDLFEQQAEFDCRERMREWIIVEAGHYMAWPVKAEWLADGRLADFMKWFSELGKEQGLQSRFPFVVNVEAGEWEIRKAKLTRFEKMDQQEFERLYQNMTEIVFQRYGFNVDAWSATGKDAA